MEYGIDLTYTEEGAGELLQGLKAIIYWGGDLSITAFNIEYEGRGEDQKMHQVESGAWLPLEQAMKLRDWLNTALPDPNQPTNVIELFSGVQESLDNLSILGRKSA